MKKHNQNLLSRDILINCIQYFIQHLQIRVELLQVCKVFGNLDINTSEFVQCFSRLPQTSLTFFYLCGPFSVSHLLKIREHAIFSMSLNLLDKTPLYSRQAIRMEIILQMWIVDTQSIHQLGQEC